jgi:hypothetical protein
MLLSSRQSYHSCWSNKEGDTFLFSGSTQNPSCYHKAHINVFFHGLPMSYEYIAKRCDNVAFTLLFIKLPSVIVVGLYNFQPSPNASYPQPYNPTLLTALSNISMPKRLEDIRKRGIIRVNNTQK